MKVPYVGVRTDSHTHTPSLTHTHAHTHRHSFMSGACRSVKMSDQDKRKMSSGASVFWQQKAVSPFYNSQCSSIFTRIKNSWSCHCILISSILLSQAPVCSQGVLCFFITQILRTWWQDDEAEKTFPLQSQEISGRRSANLEHVHWLDCILDAVFCQHHTVLCLKRSHIFRFFHAAANPIDSPTLAEIETLSILITDFTTMMVYIPQIAFCHMVEFSEFHKLLYILAFYLDWLKALIKV